MGCHATAGKLQADAAAAAGVKVFVYSTAEDIHRRTDVSPRSCRDPDPDPDPDHEPAPRPRPRDPSPNPVILTSTLILTCTVAENRPEGLL